MAYATKDQFAVKENYADWDAYAADNPSAPTESHIEDMLTEASYIINMNIGSFATDITDTRFTPYLQDLCCRMVKRMGQIDVAQGNIQSIPMFSPNDFLIEREREYLRKIGRILSYRKVGKIAF